MIRKNEVPLPSDPTSIGSQFEAFHELVEIVRQECPWDKKQTNESIAHLLIEECYEAIESIENKDDHEFSKELGDLLLHIVMHSIMAQQRGAFSIIDVINRIKDKLVFRHPHVFGDLDVDDEHAVTRNWEQLKKQEGRLSALDGVPKNLPALLRAERIQYKASKVGFDWHDKSDVWEKVDEELKEVKDEIFNKSNGDPDRISEEIGDLLFAVVNAARFESVVAEEVLQRANEKFAKRFRFIEKKAASAKLELTSMSLEEMDEYWNEAKSIEKKISS